MKRYKIALTVILAAAMLVGMTSTAFASVADVYLENGEAVDESSQPKMAQTKELWFHSISGENRYSTATALAEKAFPSAPKEIVLVTGVKFPDALSANAYAGAVKAPVILSRLTALPLEVKGLLESSWGKRVKTCTIIGGGFAAQVTDDLKACGVTEIKNVFGADRFATAEEVMKAGFGKGYFEGDTVVVATGLKAADALSVSPWSYKLRYPILLANAEGELRDSTAALIKKYGFKKVILLGDVKDSCACGLPFTRLKGEDRYETSLLIARYFVDTLGAGEYQGTGFALGLNANYPDALVAGMLQGGFGAPIILTKEDQENVLDFCRSTLSDINRCNTFYFVGAAAKGKSTAYDQTVKAIMKQ